MKARSIPGLAIALLAAAGAPAFAADAQVLLHAQATPRGAQVYLGDVAYVRSTDLKAVQRLVALPLGRAPHAGAQARLSRDTVARWARSQLGEVAVSARWDGAEEVLVDSPGAGAAPVAAAPQDAAADAAPVPVARGEWVTLLARSGGIELESRAEALQDGRIGQPVRVRTQGSSGSVVARVVAPGRVEMTP